jgi:hypothetical protein
MALQTLNMTLNMSWVSNNLCAQTSLVDPELLQFLLFGGTRRLHTSSNKMGARSKQDAEMKRLFASYCFGKATSMSIQFAYVVHRTGRHQESLLQLTRSLPVRNPYHCRILNRQYQSGSDVETKRLPISMNRHWSSTTLPKCTTNRQCYSSPTLLVQVANRQCYCKRHYRMSQEPAVLATTNIAGSCSYPALLLANNTAGYHKNRQC